MEGPNVLRAITAKFQKEQQERNQKRFANIILAVNTLMRSRASEGHSDIRIDNQEIYYNDHQGSGSPIRYSLDATEVTYLIEQFTSLGYNVSLQPHNILFVSWKEGPSSRAEK